MNTYRRLAAQVAAEVASGRLRPGDRLPPQRAFAYERGIAPSTAARVYAELVRRGIAAGEVGRGTYIRAPGTQPGPALAEPVSARIDMETNYPLLPDQQDVLAPALSVLSSRRDALKAAMSAASVQGNAAARALAARDLAEGEWIPSADSILFAGNGRQALAAAFSALVPQGERIGFEALTYPVACAIAARLGVEAVPLAMDDDGLRPDAVEKAHKIAPLRAIYLQPTLHNPLGTTMSAGRRADLAALLQRLQGPIAVEDRVYAFLDEQAPPPLAAFAPDRVVVMDSLSKRVAPGLTLGFLSAPAALVPSLARALVSGAWAASGFSLDLGTRWLSDGTVDALAARKRADALRRQTLARAALTGYDIKAHPAAYHFWFALPQPWRADAYVLAAERQGIAITPASAFAVSAGYAPNAVRIALAPPGLDELRSALGKLAALAGTDTDPTRSAWTG